MTYSPRISPPARPRRTSSSQVLGPDALRAVREADATMSHNWEPDRPAPAAGPGTPRSGA